MRIVSTLLAGAACLLTLVIAAPAAGINYTANTAQNHNSAISERSQRWAPETLSGTIMMVDPAQHLLVIKTPDGVPYDMVVTPRTMIESGSQSVKLRDLSSDVNQNVSVRFRPEGRGDIARSIQLNG